MNRPTKTELLRLARIEKHALARIKRDADQARKAAADAKILQDLRNARQAASERAGAQRAAERLNVEREADAAALRLFIRRDQDRWQHHPLPTVSFSEALQATARGYFLTHPGANEVWWMFDRLVFEVWHSAFAHQDLLCHTPQRKHKDEIINAAIAARMVYQPNLVIPDLFGFFRKDYL